jgi:HSP20 family molecular chaperone IbpA
MNSDKPHNNASFDPTVRKTEDGRHIHFSIDLPGVAEEQIRIDLEKTNCTLGVLTEDRIMKKAIRIPPGTRLSRKRFSDGILEIILERPAI